MRNAWNEEEARRFARRAEEDGLPAALGERVYSSRLIGSDPDLVLHGGGNTSVKIEGEDGEAIIHIKGSGWDLGDIEAPGLPAVRLAPLLAVRDGERLSDTAMVALLRSSLIEPDAPTPSVEALLHAFLPHRFVDHGHASAVLALANQPDMRPTVDRLYGDRMAFVPYVMPGYDLSIAGDAVFREAGPGCEGLWLENHGLFTFGESARESYDRLVAFVTLAEEELARGGATLPPPEPGDRPPDPELERRLRSALAREGSPFASGMASDFRSSPSIRAHVGRSGLEEIAGRGTVTPDHVIRIKPFPMILDRGASEGEIAAAIDTFIRRYEEYFRRNDGRSGEPRIMLDPYPRVVLVRGEGLFGIGRTPKEAAIAADLSEQTARVVNAAEDYDTFSPLGEADIFDMEYWELEQNKLKGQ